MEGEFLLQRLCWSGCIGRDPRCRCVYTNDKSSVCDAVTLCLLVIQDGSAKEILEGPAECLCSAPGRFPEFVFVPNGIENPKFQN